MNPLARYKFGEYSRSQKKQKPELPGGDFDIILVIFIDALIEL